MPNAELQDELVWVLQPRRYAYDGQQNRNHAEIAGPGRGVQQIRNEVLHGALHCFARSPNSLSFRSCDYLLGVRSPRKRIAEHPRAHSFWNRKVRRGFHVVMLVHGSLPGVSGVIIPPPLFSRFREGWPQALQDPSTIHPSRRSDEALFDRDIRPSPETPAMTR